MGKYRVNHVWGKFSEENEDPESYIFYSTKKHKQKQNTACEWMLFPKLVHSSCIKPHFSSLWFKRDPLWSACVSAHVHMCTCESVCCGRCRYSVWLKKTVSVPLLPSVVVTLCVYAVSSSCVCICMCVCLWVRKQVCFKEEMRISWQEILKK